MHAAPLPDGRFDLAVNGGGRLTLNVRRDGFLPAQRWIDVPWQDYLVVDDIALVQRDVQTTVDLTLPAPMQVARGSVQTDDDGTRRATLLVPQGTTAQMVMSNGSTSPISTLSISATEYAVGDNGEASMAADLPPNSGYTYMVELRVAQYQLDVQLTDTLPAPQPKRVELEVHVAGQVIRQTHPATPNLTTTVTWDGKDLYGRTVLGRQSTRVRIGYVYDAVYQRTDAFGYNGNGTPMTGSRQRFEVTLWQDQIGTAALGT